MFRLIRLVRYCRMVRRRNARLRLELRRMTRKAIQAEEDRKRLDEELEAAKAAIRIHESEARSLWLVIERDRSRIGAELAQHERAKMIAVMERSVAEDSAYPARAADDE